MTKQSMNPQPQYNITAKKIDFDGNINDAIIHINELPKNLHIICDQGGIIETNKIILSAFSPMLSEIFSDPYVKSPTLFIPNCSISAVEHFLNIISTGFTNSNKDSYRTIADVLQIAKMLTVDIFSLDQQDIGRKFLDDKSDVHNILNEEYIDEKTINNEATCGNTVVVNEEMDDCKDLKSDIKQDSGFSKDLENINATDRHHVNKKNHIFDINNSHIIDKTDDFLNETHTIDIKTKIDY